MNVDVMVNGRPWKVAIEPAERARQVHRDDQRQEPRRRRVVDRCRHAVAHRRRRGRARFAFMPAATTARSAWKSAEGCTRRLSRQRCATESQRVPMRRDGCNGAAGLPVASADQGADARPCRARARGRRRSRHRAPARGRGRGHEDGERAALSARRRRDGSAGGAGAAVESGAVLIVVGSESEFNNAAKVQALRAHPIALRVSLHEAGCRRVGDDARRGDCRDADARSRPGSAWARRARRVEARRAADAHRQARRAPVQRQVRDRGLRHRGPRADRSSLPRRRSGSTCRSRGKRCSAARCSSIRSR